MPDLVEPQPRRKLSEELMELASRFAERTVTLRETIQQLGQSAYSLLLILLALPFITPIALPGLSTPFGLAILLIALRMAMGRRPWLPKSLQRRQIPAGLFANVLKVSAKILRFLETFLRPRWAVLVAPDVMRRMHAGMICLAAAILLLPLPIPFSNTFPAWTVLLVAAGLMIGDGVAVVCGWLAFAAGVVYLVFLGEAAERIVDVVWRWLKEM